MKQRKKFTSGITLVEILVALAIALVFLTGVNQLISVGLAASEVGRLRSTAAQLATEGIEAMYNIRENGGIEFTDGWSGITAANEYYQPTLSVATWNLGSKLSASPPTVLSSPYNRFTRTVKIEEVRRNLAGIACSGDISNSGPCTDKNTRKIIVTVYWFERGTQKTYITSSLLTNI